MGRIRRNNLQGHDRKYIKHGHLTSRKTLRNLGFNQVPDLTEEERRRELSEKLKPYKLDLSKHIPIEAKGPVGEGPTPGPDCDYTYTLSAETSLGQLLVLAGSSTTTTGQKSYDGVNWSGVTYSLTTNQVLAYSDTLGVFVSGDGRRFSGQKLSYSYSGDTWTVTGPSTGDRVNDLKWLSYAGLFMTAPNESSGAYRSNDGINWTGITYPIVGGTDQYLIMPLERDSITVAIREDGEIYTTVSGDTFTLVDNTTFKPNNRIAIPYWNDTLNIMVGIDRNYGNAGYSYDGLTWTATTSPLNGLGDQLWSTNSITHRTSDGLMIAVSYQSNRAMTSTDGINWTATTVPSSAANYLAVEYVPDLGLFILMNRNGDIWTSPDASTWTPQTKTGVMDVFTINYGYIK